MLLQPYINKMLRALTEKQHLLMVVLSVFLFSCVPSLLRKDFFKFSEGYSFVWLLILYVIGAYFGRCPQERFAWFQKLGGIVFLFLSLVLVLVNIVGAQIFGRNIRYLVSYISPVTVAMAVSAFLALSGVKHKTGVKLLRAVSATAFEVYIIHSHIFTYELLLKGAFGWVGKCPWYAILMLIPLCSVLIFAVCSALGFMRIKLFETTKMNRFLGKISALVDSLIYT